MVERNLPLDTLFQALADSTRRDILVRVSQLELSITELAKPYAMSFAAIAKHISVLERANLIRKKRRGKEQMISIAQETLRLGEEHFARYQQMWNERFDKLEQLLVTKEEDTE